MIGAHVMLDLETLSVRPNAAILSIGACVFDPHNAVKIDHTFYMNVEIESCLRAGLAIDGSTVAFWMHEDRDVARRDLLKDPKDLAVVLDAFVTWWYERDAAYVWAHGASFDPVILESACRAIDRLVPWKYNALRDTRTLFDITGIDLKDFHSAGVEHNALADAIHQSLGVQEAYRRFRRGRNT